MKVYPTHNRSRLWESIDSAGEEAKSVLPIFNAVKAVIGAECPCELAFPGAPVEISRVDGGYGTICVTHQLSGYGWGVSYSLKKTEVKITSETSITIRPATYVWAVIVGGDDYMLQDPKCVRTFESEEDAKKWSIKVGGGMFRFRHHKSS